MKATRREVRHALSFDIEDWFHIVEIKELEDPSRWARFPSIVERYTDQIIETLRRSQTAATFFVLGWIAERHPDLVRRIRDAGHEIGSHSFWHRRVDQLSEEEFRRDLALSMQAIEHACGVVPQGYRAPSFSIRPGCEWAFDAMLDLGIRWDASLFPAARGHGGYPCPDAPHLFNALPSGRRIPVLPLSQYRFAGRGFCFSGGGYLRMLPYWTIRHGFRSMAARGLPAVVYLHPRDFSVDCPRVRMPPIRRFKCYVGLQSTQEKLERLLQAFPFAPCGEVLSEWGLGNQISVSTGGDGGIRQ
jgi:polysaccharide deacetylase family protein (PEP-CTERM system associated)